MPIQYGSIDDPYGIRQAGSILGQALMQRNMEQLQNQRNIEAENRTLARQKELFGMQDTAGIEAEKRKQGYKREDEAAQLTQQQQKFDKFKALNPNLAAMFGEDDADMMMKAAESGIISPESLFEMAYRKQMANDKPRQKTPFQKKMQDQAADLVINAPKIYSMGEDISRLRELSGNLQGLTGYGKAALNTQEAAEFNALGLTMMEPVLKVFNPVGAIPVQKIELVKSKYAPNAWDTASTIEGKLRAAEKFQKLGEKKLDHLNSLVEEYGSIDDIPDAAWLQYNRESERDIDNLIKSPIEGESKQESKTFDKFPSASDYKGKRIVDEETGAIFKSNGSRWEKVK